VLELAEQLGNVSEAAKISGVSRDTIYRHRKLIREGGLAALKRQINTEQCHQNRTDESIANTVIEFSLDNPHLGQVQVANQLWNQYEIDLCASAVRNVRLREYMQTIGLRLQKKASMSALL
jgi:predicted DNA-binding transcriptional regulator AlpA